MHGLRNMFYFERRKHSFTIFPVFVCGNLSTQCSFSFVADFATVFLFFFFGKVLSIVTKCSVLDVAGVLNPLQYVPT